MAQPMITFYPVELLFFAWLVVLVSYTGGVLVRESSTYDAALGLTALLFIGVGIIFAAALGGAR